MGQGYRSYVVFFLNFLMLTSFTCLTVFCLTLFSLVFFFFYIFSHGFLSCFPWKPLPGDASNWRPTPQNQLTDKNTRTKYSGCHEIASAPATEDSAEFGGQVAQQRGSLLKPTSVVRRILRSSLMKIGLELLQIIVIVLLPVLPPVDFGDREHHHHPTRSSFWIRNHISLCIVGNIHLDFGSITNHRIKRNKMFSSATYSHIYYISVSSSNLKMHVNCFSFLFFPRLRPSQLLSC